MEQKDSRQKRELIEAAKSNDALAFVKLLGLYSGLISSMASTFGLPKAEFDDLCQEGRLALYRAVMGYNGDIAEFSTYAGACIKNSMISWAKKANREKQRVLCTEVDLEEIPQSISDNLSDNAIAEEILSGVLNSNQAGLSDYEKKTIALKLEGYDIKSMAKLMCKEEKSVENTLFRARAKLKKYLRG